MCVSYVIEFTMVFAVTQPRFARYGVLAAAVLGPGLSERGLTLFASMKSTRREEGRSMNRRDEDLLIWFYEEGIGAFSRSPFGVALERQAALAYGEDGRRIPKATAWTHAADVAHRHRPGEASYMPDETLLLRAASVSRRLRRVAAADPRAEQTLEVYYGFIGARWARSTEGRVFALYPLTEAGARLVLDDIGAHRDAAALPHERIAHALCAQRASPSQERRELLARMRTQAERRLLESWRVWRETEAANDTRVAR
jgi:hypothetical protein